MARHARGARRAVQLGVGEGELAALVRKALDPRGTLALVDSYPGPRALRVGARRRLTQAGGAELTWLRRTASEAVVNWWGPIDLLVIDGPRDWADWAGFLEPGAPVLLRAVPEPRPPAEWEVAQLEGTVALLCSSRRVYH